MFDGAVNFDGEAVSSVEVVGDVEGVRTPFLPAPRATPA